MIIQLAEVSKRSEVQNMKLSAPTHKTRFPIIPPNLATHNLQNLVTYAQMDKTKCKDKSKNNKS